MSQSKGKLYASTFKKFLHASLGLDYSVEDIQQGLVPNEVKLLITPKSIVDYFHMASYGHLNPQENDFPTLKRSNTLLYWKKAISNYMLMGNSPWDELSLRGNPTKSKEVNDCIKAVMKAEVRNQGVPMAARHAMEYKEFLNLLTIVRKKANIHENDEMECQSLKWCRLLSLLTLQWQLIGRMDDMVHMKFSNLTPNIEFAFSIKCKLRWSKNIREERDVPEQIVVSCNDSLMDPLLNLGVYIESYGRDENLTRDSFLFGGESSTYSVRRLFDEALSNDEFNKLVKGKLGTHSVRKGASTYGTRSGLSREYVIRRGRWRSKKQVVDLYIDMNQPYPDALAACKLCGPKGACRFKINHSTLTDSFILNKVVPYCDAVLDEQAALALGKAVLWAAFEDLNNPNSTCPCLPSWLRTKVTKSFFDEYGEGEVDPVFNPISKVTIIPQGAGDQVHLIEVGVEPEEREGGERERETIVQPS